MDAPREGALVTGMVRGSRAQGRARALALAALFAGVASCAELPDLRPGVCGNGVIEEDRGEQCDLSEDPSLGDGTRCADPSDTVRACRYVCSRTDPNAAKCPRAWGCGDDGVCHHAAGTFVETEDSPLELLPYSKLSLADVDGDGRQDLVTGSISGVSVHFAKKDGSFSTNFDYGVQNVASATMLGDLDEDGATDLVVSSLAGPIVLRGQRDHTLAPVIFSRITAHPEADVMHVTSLTVAPVRLPPCALATAPTATSAVALVAYEGGLELLVPALDLHYAVRAPAYDGAPPSRMIVADVDDDPTTDEILLAPPGAGRVHVISLGCRSASAAKLELATTVELPASVAGLGSTEVSLSTDNLIIARVDDDAYPDLIVAVEAAQPGFPPRVAVARGVGHGQFKPAELDPRFCALAGFCDGQGLGSGPNGQPTIAYGRAWPLAAGDLDGDGVADYVGANGVFLTSRTTGELVQVASPRRLSYWSSAVVADLNGDGLPDVAAASDDTLVLGVELSLSSVIGTTTRRAYETQSKLVSTLGLPGALRAGDFDGDGIRDLAFLEAGLLREVTLSVVFGGSFERVSMGNPGHLASLERGDATGDGTEDLMMSMNEGDDATPVWSVGVMFGTEARRLISPVPLGQLATRAEVQAMPGARALVGRFLGNDAHLDLLVFDELELMVLPGDGKGRFALEEPIAQHWRVSDLMPGIDQFRADCVHFTTAAVDPSTVEDQLIAVAESNCAIPVYETTPGSGTGSGGTGGGSTAPDPALLGQIMIFGGANSAGVPRVAKLALPDGAGQLAGAWVMDLDGNGKNELVLANTGDATDGGVPGIRGPGQGVAVGDGATLPAGLFVYWNLSVSFAVPDADEPVVTFDARTDVALPTVGSVPLAAVPINIDGDEALELAVLVAESDAAGSAAASTSVAVHLVDFDGQGTYRVAEVPALTKSISPLGVPQLATTDVDRDGLADLIYGDGAQVFIYRATPYGEGGAAK